ncbi:hypothetical protein Pfo_009243, partial [Paulownia fortunei]
HFKLHNDSTAVILTEILQRYHSRVETESSPSTGVCEVQAQYSQYSRFLTCGELLQIVERELGEPFVDQLNVTDLVHLENQLEAALIQTRTAKTHLLLDSLSSLHEKEKMLAEEKRLLEEKIAGSKTNKAIIDLNVIPDGQMIE